jgi:uncharacterized protein YbjT (DUF2867 family)
VIAVIAGSTGLVGTLLLRDLLADTTITQVISVSRSSNKIPHPKLLELLIPDLSELSSVENKLKGDLYFCCLGTTIKVAGSKQAFRKVDFTAIAEFGRIAKAQGAKALSVISAAGANEYSMFFYNQVKGETETALISLQLPGLVIFRPGFLVGERKEFRLAEKAIDKTLVPLARLLPKTLKKKIMTRAEVLAQRMLQEAKGASTRIKIIEAKAI